MWKQMLESSSLAPHFSFFRLVIRIESSFINLPILGCMVSSRTFVRHRKVHVIKLLNATNFLTHFCQKPLLASVRFINHDITVGMTFEKHLIKRNRSRDISPENAGVFTKKCKTNTCSVLVVGEFSSELALQSIEIAFLKSCLPSFEYEKKVTFQ